MRRTSVAAGVGLAIGLAASSLVFERAVAMQGAPGPRFQVDPQWPTVPARWTLGQVSGLDVDARDHVSRDAAQRYLYLADAGNGKVHIFDRQTLDEVGSVGRIGRYAGQFVFLHNVAVDSAGNLYTAEVGGGRRVPKFLLARP